MAFDGKAIKKKAIGSMTPRELLLELLDKAALQIRRGIEAIGARDYDAANRALIEAQNIVAELHFTIKNEDRRAQSAKRVLELLLERLFLANINKDAAALEEIFQVVRRLKATCQYQAGAKKK